MENERDVNIEKEEGGFFSRVTDFMVRRKKPIIIVAACVIAVAAVVCALILLLGGGGQAPGEHSEAGVYYFDARYDEYTLTLNAGGEFALIVKSEAEFGSYTLEDGTLTLDFANEEKPNIVATIENNVVTLNYGGSSMRFLKKINYTVSFDTDGGSAVPEIVVVNGKTLAKPEDPTREDYLFVGWYADAQFKQPFAFNAQSITADTVIYARWSAASTSPAEHSVRFDLGYSGAPAIDAINTYGGKVFDLPTPERDGYEFCGWWVSMLNDSEKLSYECKDGTALDASTTLYALWSPIINTTKLPAPTASVSSASVSWSTISGARSYEIKVTNASGTVVFDETTSSTTLNVPFDTYAPGEYVISVTALATSGDSNNSECTRYFVNKSLPKVSAFNVVEPAILNFNTVPGAEKYLITVVCGNPAHNHTDFDNGSSRSFSFANCDMTADGISFTVTAVADGYAPSTSETFVYKRSLPAVEGLRVDDATQTVHWNEVPGAGYYMVSVSCGNASHSHGYINNGTKLSVCLKECAPTADGITVKVYPVTRGYISPEAAELHYNKTNLSTPSDIRLSGHTLSWSAVAGATKYEIKVGATTYNTTAESYDLSGIIDPVEGTEYVIAVRAIGSTESAWSDELCAIYLEKPVQVSYSGNILSWSPVIGAASYEVQINDEAVITVSGGVTCSEITLPKAGINRLKVRFADGSNHSDWATIDVFAHTVTFDSREGSPVNAQYVAVGDRITLPSPTKTGYDFIAWYNVPGGPVCNGGMYTDEVFSESGSIVLYAYYTSVGVNVTLNAGPEAGGDKILDQIGYEEYFKLSIPTPLSPTMAFGGWFSAPGGKGEALTDAKGNSLSHWDSLESTELHAFWIDYALEFTLTKVNGVDAYMVSAGDRIAMLDEVTVPSNFNELPVAMVAGNAFKNCTALKVINLPDTLLQISLVDPFTGCTSLEAINVYNTDRGSDSRYWSDNGVLFDNGTATVAQPKLIFMPLAKTGSYRIPSGIVEIPERAFAGSSLSRVTVPASVTKIGIEAFSGCQKLTSVAFEAMNGAEPLTIEARAFLDCGSLEKITLPKRLASIALTKYSVTGTVVSSESADNAFVGCHSLSSINVAAGNTAYKSVGGVLYSADGKTLLLCPSTQTGEFSIPIGTQTVAPGAFIGCDGITGVTIPNTVTTVGDYAFYGLRSSLTEVTFSGNGFNDVTVGKYAFSGCSSLSDIVLEPGSRLTVLDEGAFYGCAITEFEIPATTTSIGRYAFYGCGSLTELSFADGGKPLTFGEEAFAGCYSLKSVHIPANVSEIPGVFSGCTTLTGITIDEDNPYFESEDGVVFNKGRTEIVFFPMGKLGEYTLPSTVTSIANGVFSFVTGITKLTLPNTLTYIGDKAFSYSGIKEIVFSGSTYADELYIGKGAFESTSKLETLALPPHTKSIGDNAFTGSAIENLTLNEGLETIGSYAFSSTYSLFSLVIPGSVRSIGDHCFSAFSSISSITLSEGIEVIGKNAFAGTYYLSSITIPASVTKIDDYAFADSVLSSITFTNNSRLEVIGAHAFEKTKIASISLPKSLTSVGAHAFYYCTALGTVTFEDGGSGALVIGAPYVYTHKDEHTDNMVTDIQVGRVFEGASALTSVIFPSNLSEIRARSFESAGSASGLTVSFGDNSRLTTIGDYCFYNSTLTSITIPKSVCNLEPVVGGDLDLSYDRLGIGRYAFACDRSHSSKLSTVSFEMGGDAPLTIGAGAFSGADGLTGITISKRLAPYTRISGETVSGLEGGASVFSGISALGSISIEDGGSHYADVDGIVYTADLSELIFCPAGYVGAVSIPSSVTRINDKAFYGCVGVSEISFVGGSLDLVIGESAFAGCEGITSITLPENAKSLGKSAFAGCTALESITLSKHINKFDSSMIENCPALKSIEVAGGVDGSGFFYDNGALYSADKTTLVLFTNSTATTFTALPSTVIILSNAFSGNTSLSTVVLPEGLREIGASAFAGCTALTTVNIPKSVETIGESAFDGCRRLSSVTFAADGIVDLVIGDGAFANSGLVTVELPVRTTSVGNRAFASSDLRQITLPEGLISIGDAAFESSRVERVQLPASLKTMGINAFRLCRSLEEVIFAPSSAIEILRAGTFSGSSITSITIPASVTVIENKEDGNFSSYGVFESCTSLRSVTFVENGRLVEIGQRAFYGCTSIEEIEIPSTVSTVGFMAFYTCTGLESVTIPATATALGHSIFYGCTALKNVTLLSKTTELPINTFYNCSSLSSITIPVNVTTIGDNCFYGANIGEFRVAAGNTAFAARDGVLYKAGFTEILIYPSASTAESITIPKELTSIKADIFTGATALKSIIFEAGGTQPLTIEAYAFQNCYQLHTVILPERLSAIGSSAFENCFSLISITIPSNVTSIGDYAFSDCHKLVEVYNKSDLSIAKNDLNGMVGKNALNIYTPNSGSSILSVDANGYVTVLMTAGQSTLKYLVGYVGSEKSLVIPADVDAFYKYAFYRLEGLESIIIPAGAGAEGIGANAFVNCGLPHLIFEDSSIPTAWGTGWNSDGCPVALGYDGEEHTYTFNTDGGTAISPIVSDGIITLPTPSKSGMVFAGWYLSSDLNGDKLADNYYSSVNVTLYAKWVNEGEVIPDGTSEETAFEITLGESVTVHIDVSEKKVYYKFTPTVSGIYHAYIAGHAEATLKLQGKGYYPNSNNVIDTDLPVLMVGNTYYFVVSLTSAGTAELTFTLTLTDEVGDGGEEEGGDSFDDPIELELNKESSALIETAGDSVYFTFTPSATGKFNVYVYGTGATLTVYGADRETVVDTIINSSISGNKDVELTEGVTYYLAVTVPSNDFRTYVKVKEAVQAPGGNTPEEDTDEFEGAVPLTAGNSVNLQFATGQKMYFVYTATANGEHRIYADCGWNYCGAEVYSDDKVKVAGPFEDSFGILNATVDMTAGETYYIVLYMRYSSSGSLSFTFTAPAVSEPEEPDDEIAEIVGATGFSDAFEISVGTTYPVKLDTYGKKVYLKYTATETGNYRVLIGEHDNVKLSIYTSPDDTTPTLYQASWATHSLDKELTFTEGQTDYLVVYAFETIVDLEFILTSPDAEG